MHYRELVEIGLACSRHRHTYVQSPFNKGASTSKANKLGLLVEQIMKKLTESKTPLSKYSTINR
jgi:hypothetical protein